jgi:hypothetical protein
MAAIDKPSGKKSHRAHLNALSRGRAWWRRWIIE